ncbi:hypothetical protein GCM10022198_25700 [Klugiella xanthotipulae]|uniref:SIR2-like protein n=1 Tax=Klugiella xanthotipulae TaxID=244735 RepID=A0A543I5L6_9MICO|nr:hypothetical protein [Klugiella xanthotipulae]TQM65896.1 hypothetical protein FB466_0716 [Klugiella xanthotipulae]
MAYRHHTPFFEQSRTHADISRIGEEERDLLIYCGAGVTIDHTGYSWGGLVTSLFPVRRGSQNGTMPLRREAQQLGSFMGPAELASVYIHHLRKNNPPGLVRARLVRELRTRLYTQQPWARGNLVKNIIWLVIARALRGRTTVVLTTNYDVHVETEFLALYRLFVNQGMSRVPGLSVRTLGARPGTRVIVESIGDTPPLTIVYLHGRMPERGQAAWPIVLNERSYAESAVTVSGTLGDYLSSHPMTLILGSSLTDIPLVRALSDSRVCAERERFLRYAVLPFQSISIAGDTNCAAMAADEIRCRGSEMGLEVIFPDFHGQVAQLTHEITAASATVPGVPYGTRLSEWWERWLRQRDGYPTMPDNLRVALGRVYLAMGDVPPTDPLVRSTERYRIEAWLRTAPSRRNRVLTRWATSDDVRSVGLNGKTAEINSSSYLAAVQAFVAGRPQSYGVQDLEPGRAADHGDSRYTWRSFLAVPVECDGVIVAVITLASSQFLSSSQITEWKRNVLTLLLRACGTDVTRVAGP